MTDALVSLTPAAVARVRHLLANQAVDDQAGPALGIRLDIKPTGCSGFSYLMDFARDIKPADRVVEEQGVKLVVDAKTADVVAGTRVDFVEDRLGAQFVFSNPNEKGRCGCGESFNV